MTNQCTKCNPDENNVAENWKRLGIGILKFLGWTALIIGTIGIAILAEDYRRDRGYYYRRWY